MDMNFKTKEKDSKDSLQIVQKYVIFKLFYTIFDIGTFILLNRVYNLHIFFLKYN